MVPSPEDPVAGDVPKPLLCRLYRDPGAPTTCLSCRCLLQPSCQKASLIEIMRYIKVGTRFCMPGSPSYRLEYSHPPPPHQPHSGAELPNDPIPKGEILATDTSTATAENEVRIGQVPLFVSYDYAAVPASYHTWKNFSKDLQPGASPGLVLCDTPCGGETDG